MAMHPTRKQSNFYLSLKKRIIDSSVSEVFPIHFSALTDIPRAYTTGDEYDKWVAIEVGDKIGEDISEQLIHLHLFTKKDAEFDNMMALEDTVMLWFLDENGHLDGFDFYNTELETWEKIGGVKVYQERVSDTSEFKSGIKFKTITLLCKWAAI